ncbi:unnamed protein product [Hanseniaspora opuntiae]
MTTDKDLNATSYDKFKAKFESTLSKLDCNRVTDPFYIIKGLPEGLKQSSSPVYLAGGMPHESMFPFKHVSVKYREAPGSLGKLEGSTVTEEESYNSYDIPLYSEAEVKNKQSDIARAFQYSENTGLESLREFTRQIIKKVNTPVYDNWDVLITSGSSDSLSKVCDLFVDEDTTVLCEEFTFVNICSHVSYAQGSCVPVKLEVSDDPKSQGIDTAYLSDLLENWSTYYPEKKKKLVLYTIATGQNPTGDDPYGYLQLPKYNAEDPLKNPYQDKTITLDVFCSELLKPSYMTIDTEGRVLRLETFSKVGSPGLRLGFIAANTYLIDRLSNISFMTSRNASGISQSITNNLLLELGTRYQKEVDSKASLIDGWFNWCMKIAGEYTHRRNVLFKAIHETEACKKGYFQLLEPSCGMFATIVVNLKPEWIDSEDKTKRKDQIKRVMDYLLCCLLETGCLPILGYKMTICRDFSMDRANFLRITFAKAESAEIFEQGAKNMSAAFERLNEEYMTEKELWDLPATGLVGM